MESPSRSNEFTTGTFLVLLTVIIWGVQFPVAKHSFESVNAFHSSIFRFSLPALILLMILVIREGWASVSASRETLKVIGLGVIGMCGAPSLIFGGLMFTRPEIAAIIVATQPLMTVLVQRFLGGSKTSMISLICIFAAFLGVVTVVTRWESTVEIPRSEILADLMILIGALCFVLYTISTSSYRHWSSLRLTTVSMLGGAAANTLLVTLLVTLGLIAHPSIADWLNVKWELMFLAFVGVLGAMFTWNLGSKKIGPLNAMLFINLIPIVTFIIRYWQGYRFEAIELIGAAMVITALSVQNVTMRIQQRKKADY
jgi:drug/metabolite transporter (DMT)-like permease